MPLLVELWSYLCSQAGPGDKYVDKMSASDSILEKMVMFTSKGVSGIQSFPSQRRRQQRCPKDSVSIGYLTKESSDWVPVFGKSRLRNILAKQRFLPKDSLTGLLLSLSTPP
uniref:COesterase domain-containing protein n=1 Tax=Steinernema glaseri TaxID=37863 RepID=A0A1I8ALN6_9BILA